MHTFTTERLRFESHGDRLVADLFRPIDAEGDSPAIVVTGSWTTSKEQQANFYARRLASRGFTTLTFDFRGFGQSEGNPRNWEDPGRKVQDIHAAVGFAASLEGVSAKRIGALGICASAGYQSVNAATDGRVRALGLVAPWLHTLQLVGPYYGGPEGVARRIERSREARANYLTTGTVEFMPAVSTSDPTAAMFGPFDYYLDPQRGAIPEWDARLAVMSWEPWLTFNPIKHAAGIKAPVRMVHSDKGAVPEGARAFHARLAGEKDLIWTDGNQLDFYDQPAQVGVALDAMVDHFAAHL